LAVLPFLEYSFIHFCLQINVSHISFQVLTKVFHFHF
jgi:hypothetical protein